jgi:glutamate carboxypeptidase
MDPLLEYAQSKQSGTIALLREFVECESPSDSPAAVNRFVDLFVSRVSSIAKVRTFSGEPFGRHLRCEFLLPGPRRKQGQILALGHSDTVWPLGTLGVMPWRESGGRLWGPGVLDMKAGLAFFVTAMNALRELDLPVRRKVVLQINADEEVGSETSRPLTEAAARESVFVLVLEPGTGLEGKWKTARKGVGDYAVTVRGKAAHAGIDFTAGASAIVELSRQIGVIAGFTNLDRGLTVNPGVISGGTRSNVIAAEARAEVDIRIARLKDAGPLDKRFRRLKPFDKRCTLEITGGLNRPPMERTPAVAALFRQAQAMARELGIALEESSTGGGSDGNFTAALGIPTLDGLGGVGEGAHAPNESILIDRIADRTALIAKLVAALEPAGPR